MSSEPSKTNLLKGLYAITDPQLLPNGLLISGVENAIVGGARLIQYRDKTATSIQNLRNAENLRSITKQYDAKLLINDDLELCLRVKADGVHLGKRDGSVSLARKRLGTEGLIGVTCHRDIEYAHIALEAGANYCAFGRMYSSNTKPNAPACPLEVLFEAAKLPGSTLAIGGIMPANAQELLATGVDMIAVIHGLFGQKNIQETARSFSKLFA